LRVWINNPIYWEFLNILLGNAWYFSNGYCNGMHSRQRVYQVKKRLFNLKLPEMDQLTKETRKLVDSQLKEFSVSYLQKLAEYGAKNTKIAILLSYEVRSGLLTHLLAKHTMLWQSKFNIPQMPVDATDRLLSRKKMWRAFKVLCQLRLCNRSYVRAFVNEGHIILRKSRKGYQSFAGFQITRKGEMLRMLIIRLYQSFLKGYFGISKCSSKGFDVALFADPSLYSRYPFEYLRHTFILAKPFQYPCRECGMPLIVHHVIPSEQCCPCCGNLVSAHEILNFIESQAS
jgi:hypothetical protein